MNDQKQQLKLSFEESPTDSDAVGLMTNVAPVINLKSTARVHANYADVVRFKLSTTNHDFSR